MKDILFSELSIFIIFSVSFLGQGVILGRMGGQNIEEPEFIDAEFEEDFERQLTVRKDFRETWIYEDVIIG